VELSLRSADGQRLKADHYALQARSARLLLLVPSVLPRPLRPLHCPRSVRSIALRGGVMPPPAFHSQRSLASRASQKRNF